MWQYMDRKWRTECLDLKFSLPRENLMLRHSVSTLLYKGMILSLTFFIFLLSTYNYHVYNKTLLIFTSFFKENFHNFRIISIFQPLSVQQSPRLGVAARPRTVAPYVLETSDNLLYHHLVYQFRGRAHHAVIPPWFTPHRYTHHAQTLASILVHVPAQCNNKEIKFLNYLVFCSLFYMKIYIDLIFSWRQLFFCKFWLEMFYIFKIIM